MHIGLRPRSGRPAGAEVRHHRYFVQPSTLSGRVSHFSPTHFDPTVAPPGCQILIVQKLSAVRLEDVKDWRAHKNQIEGVIMQRLREILPDIDHIVVQSSATAMTSYRFTRNWQGAMLGWEMSPDQLGPGLVGGCHSRAEPAPGRTLDAAGRRNNPGDHIGAAGRAGNRQWHQAASTDCAVFCIRFCWNTSLYGVVSK